MQKVTKESLTLRIKELESGSRSIKEDYQLAAYKMLCDALHRKVVGYTSQRAIDYEIWNSGSTVITHEPEAGDVPMMVAPDFIIEDKQ